VVGKRKEQQAKKKRGEGEKREEEWRKLAG
jgi:hypothetical protein